MLTRFARLSQVYAQRQASVMSAQSQRFYLNDLNLDATQIAKINETSKNLDAIDLWKQQVQDTKNALVLKTNDEIEQYVLSITKDYFRTTQKANLKLDSKFKDHGLDSLDTIELVIRIEDELGYVIDAENLQKFKKPRHFVNFIKHMEAYKAEFHRLPTEGTKVEFDLKKAFPGIPYFSDEASKKH